MKRFVELYKEIKVHNVIAEFIEEHKESGVIVDEGMVFQASDMAKILECTLNNDWQEPMDLEEMFFHLNSIGLNEAKIKKSKSVEPESPEETPKAPQLYPDEHLDQDFINSLTFSGFNVQHLASPEFNKTYEFHKQNTPGVERGLKRFLASKAMNPDLPYQGKDYLLQNNFAKYNVKIFHAGLTFDKSVFYTLENTGKKTKQIRLFGIYGHDDVGIGNPANTNKQNAAAKRFSNQRFDNVESMQIQPPKPVEKQKRNYGYYDPETNQYRKP